MNSTEMCDGHIIIIIRKKKNQSSKLKKKKRKNNFNFYSSIGSYTIYFSIFILHVNTTKLQT